MARNVLIGISKTCGPFVGPLMQSTLQTAIPDAETIMVAYNLEEFAEELEKKAYDIIVCLEFVGMDYGYAEQVLLYGLEKAVCLIILPESQKGDEMLRTYVNAGFRNFLFQRDTNSTTLKGRIEEGISTQEEALEYLGLIMRPVVVEQDPKPEDEQGTGTKITRQYLGNGVAVTTLCGGDVRKLNSKSKDEDPVLSNLLSDDLKLACEDVTMPYKEFAVDEMWVQQYKERIRQYYRTHGIMTLQSFENGDITRAVFERNVIKELMRLKLTDRQAGVVCASFMRDVTSYGRIDGLIQTEDVTDIRLMNKDTINVQYKGVWYRTNTSFVSDDEYRAFISRMCTINHSAINLHEPETIFTDIKTFPNLTLRVTVTHGMLSTDETYGSHIRIATKNKRTVDTLIGDGFMSRKQASLLIDAIRNKKSIIICGGSGSGKTILLNMLIEYFEPSICGTCIQESDELHSETHPNIEFLHSITAKGEGNNGYSLKKLATTSLLKNAELFIIGEIKGDESADFMTASRTSKVYATTHAEDFTGALPRITELAKATADYSQEEILRILSKSIGYVVYCEKYRCKQIAKVVGYDEIRKDVIYDLYDFEAKEA